MRLVASSALFLSLGLIACVSDTPAGGDGGDAAPLIDSPSGTDSGTDSGGMPSPVTGKVINLLGDGIGDATVIIAGMMPIKTMADGTFTIPDAPALYDVSVIASGTSTQLVSFFGLTARMATLQVPILPILGVASANGTIGVGNTSTTFPLTAGEGLTMLFATKGRVAHTVNQVDSNAYTGGNISGTNVNFETAGMPESGTFYAYSYKVNPAVSSFPQQYYGIASAPYSNLTNGGTIALGNVPLMVPGPGSGVTINYTVQPGTMTIVRWILFDPANGVRATYNGNVIGAMGLTGSFAAPIPATVLHVGGGVVMETPSRMHTSAWDLGTQNMNSFNVTAPPELGLTSPADMATSMPAFAWEKRAGAFYAVQLSCGTFVATMLTTANTVTVPTLAMAPVPKMQCAWGVIAYTSVTTLDDIVGTTGWRPFTSHRFASKAGTYAESVGRKITIQ
jgi:hypothetical protein